ncbi:MAG TPA: YncE family protein [Ktedonobacteraceae bacterium]|nr:YncE family protein [Ktedonobacteraceae bacterium]
MRAIISGIHWKFLSAFIILILVLLIAPSPVFADGGAPNVAYVAGAGAGISVIDIGQRKVTSSFGVQGDPRAIYLSVDGRLLYVTQPSLNEVSILAAKTRQVICSADVAGHPTLLALDPGPNILYAGGVDSGTVTAFDAMTCAIKFHLQVSASVNGLAVAVVGAGIAGGTGNQVWVADSSALNVFDSNGKRLAVIPMQEQPQYLCIPQGNTVYVTTRQGNLVAVNIATRQVSAPLLTGGYFGPMDYDAGTGEVYVPDSAHQAVDVMTPVSVGNMPLPREPVRTIRLDAAPQSVAITSDGQLGFVALNNGSVVMLDIPGRQIVTTIQVGGNPHFIITGLYPTLISLTPQQSVLVSILSTLLHYGGAVIIALIPIIWILRERLMKKRMRL